MVKYTVAMNENNSHINVLVVDDEPMIRTQLVTMMQDNNGIRVEEAGNGTAARQMLDEIPFDIVFLDIMLPDSNGVEILKDIRKKTQDAKVIMMTGHADVPAAVRAMQEGAVDFI